MADAPKRIWPCEGDLEEFIDNMDDAALYGPCTAYVLASIADEHKRQRDVALAALKAVVRIRNGWPEVFDQVDAAIAECKEAGDC